MSSIVDAETLLVVDVGSVFTRAILFDVVEGRYRFIAQGVARTTAAAPYRNIAEGVRLALDDLHNVTGRVLVDQDQQLIIPSPNDGSGVDRFAATVSAGDPLKVVAVGLLEDISGESVRRLAQSTYCEILQSFSLNDRRKPDTRLNLVIRSRPDLVIVAGGTNGGASTSVMGLLESVGLASYLLPESERPEVLFAGNEALWDEVKSSLEGFTRVHCAPNIRPALEAEQLQAAETTLARLYTEQRARKLPGMEELKVWAGDSLLPTASAFGRVVRFLSAFLSEKKGVLGVDVGAASTTVAAAVDGKLSLAVYPRLGLNPRTNQLPDPDEMEEILSWLTVDISAHDLREYLLNKSIYPTTLPVTPEDIEIERAVTRHVLRQTVKLARPGFPGQLSLSGDGMLPPFEPILATGSVLTRSPLGQSVLMLLDGLQPSGITTLVLDQNQIAPAVGAAAIFSPLLAVQVMDSNSFLNLGTVIAPIANVKTGQPVLRLKLTYEDGRETSMDVKQGALETLAVPYGQPARLALQPLHRADIGMGAPGRGGSLTVKGGALGVIIDARGRPFKPPKDLQKRQELYKKWLWNLRGQ